MSTILVSATTGFEPIAYPRIARVENDHEPDHPHGHLDLGWLAGV
jgi:hypothetical protein